MKHLRKQMLLAAALIALSSAIYVAQVWIFHAERDTFFYLFQDLAFVPIQILLVTVIVDQVLRIRERMALLKKLNMVIGAFFSEVGTQLLRSCISFDADAGVLAARLKITTAWGDQQFGDAVREAGAHPVRIECGRGDLESLKVLLAERRGFLLGLLENQNLLEHETFTELLWAVFHLMEELSSRKDVRALTHPDREHIAGDIKRVYLILVTEWLSYLKHLRLEYPYLFSLAVRMNPYDPDATVELK